MPLFSVAAEYVGIGSRMQEKTERTPLRLHRKDAIRYVIFASLWLGSFLAAAGMQKPNSVLELEN